jgi:1-aminocyclopropane-1-carboxylate deaminase/D-cysteine desulfhydrase-like pyridoxal-dependent ACC family enzyme
MPAPLSDRLQAVPWIALAAYPTPVDELPRLRGIFRAAPRLLIKRDDAIPFAFGGNKVRKLELVMHAALADGADTVITAGGIQSNHARVTASAAARLGLECHLVVNGTKPDRPTANALLDGLVGATVHYVATRDARAPAMRSLAGTLRARGRRVFEIPIGASTPLGALGYARAVGELLRQIPAPDVIVHATSSGGTQAGLLAGCAIHGVRSRVIGVSADDSAGAIHKEVDALLGGIEQMLGAPDRSLIGHQPIEVDDRFIGQGYAVPTAASNEAIAMLARSEGIFLDPTYTAKAMAALLAYLRESRFASDETVLFWHTGGQVALFA